MNKIIPLQGILETMARATGAPVEVSQAYIEALAQAVGDALERGHSVRIKGIGEFRADPESAEHPVLFAPDPSLAEAVNQPFAAFEAVELDVPDDVISQLMEVPEVTNMPPEVEPSEEHTEATEAAEPEAPEEVAEIPDESKEEPVEVAPAEEPLEPVEEPVEPEEPVALETDDEYYEPEVVKPRRWLFFLLGMVVGAIVGAAVMWLLLTHHQPTKSTADSDSTVQAESTVTSDSMTKPADQTTENASNVAVPAPMEDAQAMPTDTVRSNRFLTTMAREHYGHYEYWVYIFLENEADLGNPNYVFPGAVVKIPQLSRYVEGDPDSKENINAANAESYRIQQRYPKKK